MLVNPRLTAREQAMQARSEQVGKAVKSFVLDTDTFECESPFYGVTRLRVKGNKPLNRIMLAQFPDVRELYIEDGVPVRYNVLPGRELERFNAPYYLKSYTKYTRCWCMTWRGAPKLKLRDCMAL